MASLATTVDHVECAHPLEAGVRELRLLAAHAPPYNRRSRFPHRWWWVVLTDEAFPRLSVVRERRHRARGASAAIKHSGFSHISTARSARSARGPTPSTPPSCWPGSPGCAPARPASGAPQSTGRPVPNANSPPARHRAASPPPTTPPRRCGRALIEGADNRALTRVRSNITELAGRARYETAARLRDHATAAVDVLWRGQRLRALAGVDELVAAASGRRRRLAAGGHPARTAGRGGHRPPRRAPDAGRRRDMRWRTSDAAATRRRWAARWSRRPHSSHGGSPSPACE